MTDRVSAELQVAPLAAFDIETTGLDPTDSRVVAVGFASQGWSASFLGHDERALLGLVERTVSGLALSTRLVTWNGDEFDLPFLRKRFEAMEVSTSLTLTRTSETGKYGGTLYRGSWGSREIADIAPLYREKAKRLGVSWSLKPVARAQLGVEPVEVDRRGVSIAEMRDEALRAYVSSDASVTLELAEQVLSPRRAVV